MRFLKIAFACTALTTLSACANIPRHYSAADQPMALQAMFADFDRACLANLPNQNRAADTIHTMTAESADRADLRRHNYTPYTPFFVHRVYDHNIELWPADDNRFGPCQLTVYNIPPEAVAAAALTATDDRGFRFSNVTPTREQIEDWGDDGYVDEWRVAHGNGTAILKVFSLPAILNTATTVEIAFR